MTRRLPENARLQRSVGIRGSLRTWFVTGWRCCVWAGIFALLAWRGTAAETKPVTFNQGIAPLMYARCAVCHHAGQTAPFDLLTYSEVRERSQQILDVLRRRYMPPWLPEPGFGHFTGERRLTDEEIALFERWVQEGMIEGKPEELPPPPEWAEGWQLGKPDLVVTMPQPYSLSAEGRDVYRNFVLRVPLDVAKYVRGVELRPGNPKILHHAFIKVDRTARSRHLDEADAEPGFAGMSAPAEMPGGQFLTWQPGKLPSFAPDGLSWQLNPGDDLVLQMHLRPSGKPETLQASVGLYFTSQAPTNLCFKFSLCSYLIDIPAGERAYEIRDAYTLPVDVSLVGILPHAHYLCQEMEGYAVLPDGRRQELLKIPRWDFNWQGDYRYAEPVQLPKGTSLHLRFTYDNSTHNVRNPNSPPQRVRYGVQSSDEMGELWFQVLTRTPRDYEILAKDYNSKLMRDFVASEEFALRLDPQNAGAHLRLGQLLSGMGREAEARSHLETAMKLRPEDDEPHYQLGLIYRAHRQLAAAQREFETALRLNPKSFDAEGNLGLIRAELGDAAGAEAHFRAALKINPDDTRARECLTELLQIQEARKQKPQ